MNNNYYPNSGFPNDSVNKVTPNQFTAPTSNIYLDNNMSNVLNKNIGKMAKFYMSFTDSKEWGNKIFEGIIESSGRDHVIISDPKTGRWSIIVLIYLDFIEFEEPVSTIKFQPNN